MEDGRHMAGDRAGTLVRVSSGGQDEANQVPEVERHCLNRGYRVIPRCQYSLHDKSAAKGEQQATLDQIIDDVRTGKIKVLVVWKPSRIERRGTEYLCRFVRLVREAGGRVERADTGATLHENDIHTILDGYMDHEYTKALSANVRIAHQRIKDNNAFSGREPFGYEITGPKYGKQLVVDEDLRPVVVEIFKRVNSGESLADICHWLDSLQCKKAKTTSTKYAKGEVTPWWPAMLMRLIRHPAYTGRYFVKRTDDKGKLATYAHKCEAIVSRRTQDDAIRALTTRPKRGPKGDPSKRAMLKGVITCGNPECDATGAPDSPMYENANWMTSDKTLPKVPVYRCFGRGVQRKGCGCNVSRQAVDDAVNKIVDTWFNVPVRRLVLIKGHDWSEEMQEVADLMDELRPSTMTREAYDAELARLRAEHDRLNALPPDEDEWREVDTEDTYAGLYADVPDAERGEWLKSRGFTVQASKAAVRLTQRHADGKETSATVDL